MRQFILLAVVLTVCLGSPLLSHAQFGGGGNSGGGAGGFGGGNSGGGFGGGNSGGGFGGGNSGGGFGGGTSGGGFGGGTSGGGLGGSGGGFGGQGGGGQGGGGGGFGGAGGFGQGGATNGANGMNNQQGQFLGINTNQNQFLGRNVQGQGQNGALNQTGAGNRRGANNRGANNQNGMNNQQMQGGMGGMAGAKPAVVIRARQKIAFTHTAPLLTIVTSKLETRLIKMTAIKSQNLNLSVNPAGELVLKGEVASAEQAKLAENMARLEPGIRTVRNELTFPESVSSQ